MCFVFEDDFVEAGDGGDFSLVAHQAFGYCVDGVEDGEFGDTGGSCGGKRVSGRV